ncbi:Partial AB-hydrolase lipase domain [Lasallia pustulata]|uniref:Partial AB-hydrolase lipase domain n=1 Tax=Lasallia pustulata TaxID=136370 RepID=A0A1W5CVM8_9LECA|nr:Partial AB-hydrolase lipase domain [Lasallia pustulata]
MARVPFIGRLFWREYLALVGSFILIFLEAVIRIITLGLPEPVIRFCYRLSRNIFNYLTLPQGRPLRTGRKAIAVTIAQTTDFVDLCALFGYYAEEHIVQTVDGYLLGLHRLGWRRGEEDIRLGNNRGNKYSKKSTRLSPLSTAFWNYSLDQFAFHDIPDSINYILETTSQPSLSYVGFSQGTAQAFATLSIHPTLNDKVDVFIALAPAMSPPGLHNGIVNALTKASPEVIFLAFGRKSMLSSATMWQALLYPPLFVRVIDMSLSFLFNWSSQNIGAHQKLAAYPHLYSFTSTKSVVHWFQIIRNKSFQMYDDDVQAPLSIGASDRYYKVAKFPTRNIKTPIVLVYGGSDSLVDISVMLRELPRHTVAKEIPHFEHLDFLWAQEVDTLVFPHVFEALDDYAGTDHSKMRPVTYKSLHKGGTLALAGPPSYSEDERSLLTTDASEVEYLGRTTAARNYAPSPREPSSPRYMRSTQNVNNRSYVSLSSASDLASVPGDGAVESPSPARARHLRSASLRSNTKNKRSGSLSNRTSWDGTASANQFRDNSTASGVSMTIAGVGDGKGDEGSGSDGGKK